MTRLLKLKGITKRYPGVVANDDVDFELHEGELHALLGENGAGKTTLVKTLYGLVTPDEGEIIIRGKVRHINSPLDAIALGIGMVHQHFMLVPTMTVAENIMLGEESTKGPFLQYEDAIQRIMSVVAQFGIEVSPQRMISQLSVGERQRVEIVKALYRGADVLILDEPTAVLNPIDVEALFQALKSMTDRGKAVIFITHKLKEVIGNSDRVTVLRKGKVVGTVKTSDTNEKQIANMMVGRNVVFSVSRGHNVAGKMIASLRKACVKGDHDKLAVKDLDLDLRAGEIVGVAGVVGNGQHELAEAIAGLRPLTAGSLIIEGESITTGEPWRQIKRGVSYVPADRKFRGTAIDLTIVDNFALKNHRYTPYSSNGILQHKVIHKHAAQLVKEYDVRCSSVKSRVRALSGGNLQKLILARETSGNSRILVAEHPTRGLDVAATEYVREQLIKQRDEGVAELLISADLDEILMLSDRIVVMFNGSIVYECDSDKADREKIGMAMAGIGVETQEGENLNDKK